MPRTSRAPILTRCQAAHFPAPPPRSAPPRPPAAGAPSWPLPTSGCETPAKRGTQGPLWGPRGCGAPLPSPGALRAPSLSALCFQSRMWERQELEDKGNPSAKVKPEMLAGGPWLLQPRRTVRGPQSLALAPSCPSASPQAEGGALGERREAVARETSRAQPISRDHPAAHPARCARRCCSLVAELGATHQTRLTPCLSWHSRLSRLLPPARTGNLEALQPGLPRATLTEAVPPLGSSPFQKGSHCWGN